LSSASKVEYYEPTTLPLKVL
ncbi:unnamed protein product, partial [Rotaria magnacalcarata]